MSPLVSPQMNILMDPQISTFIGPQMNILMDPQMSTLIGPQMSSLMVMVLKREPFDGFSNEHFDRLKLGTVHRRSRSIEEF